MVLPVQIAVELFVIVIAGFGFTVTVYVKGIPIQVLLDGVNE